MVVVDLPIHTWIAIGISIISLLVLFFEKGEQVKKWFGRTAVESAEYEKVSKDSSIKQKIISIETELKKIDNIIDSIKLLRLENLELKIENAINHDLGEMYINTLNREYLKLGGNSFIAKKVEEYLKTKRMDAEKQVKNYYDYQNGEMKK